MNINFSILIFVFLAVVGLIVYIIIRNMKDEKDFEKTINEEEDPFQYNKKDEDHV